MPTALKIVATPLGNIRDITLRAQAEIAQADVILAEDTRHTQKLTQALGIALKSDCRLLSCDAHKEVGRIDTVLELLRANKKVILVSDAGCPAISDPGSLLVQGVIEHGLCVEVIPGPSAITAAIMGAGLDTTRFAFLGFLPKKKSARKSLITDSYKVGLALVIYESPHRINELLVELFLHLGPQRVVVARELTKIYETFHRGKLGAVLSPPILDKGECVVVVDAGSIVPDHEEAHDDINAFIKERLQDGHSAKDVAHDVALTYSMKKKDAYQRVLTLQGKI